jgi:hypothetical protein
MSTNQRVLSCYNSNCSTLLTSGQVWSGTWEDVLGYQSITTFVNTDVPSASNGLIFAFTSNTSSATPEVTKQIYNLPGQQEYTFPVDARYFQITYTNGGTGQTSFCLKTYLNTYIPEQTVTDTSYQLSKVISGEYDIFNRLRVSEPYTVLDIKHLYTFNTLQMDQYTTGLASIIHNANASTVTMSVTGTGKAIVQSRLYTQYQPGKSLLIYATGILNNGSNPTTVTTRLGYFDESNGGFFQYTNGVAGICLRSKSSGSIIDTIIPQSQWNIDTMNGSGISRITIDWTKCLIFVINIAWLGVGQVVFGIVYGGIFYPVHKIWNTALTTTYMGIPNLPIRYEIVSTSGSGSLLSICASVTSEGGYSLQGYPFSVTLGPAKTVSAAETYLFSIRLKDLRRTIIKLLSGSFLSASTGDMIFRVYTVLSPATVPINGGSLTWSSVNVNSAMEYNTNGTSATLSSAILLYQEFISDSVKSIRIPFKLDNEVIYVTAGINEGTFYSDYIICTAQKTTAGSKDVQASITWSETL